MDPIWTGYITKKQFFELDKFDEFTVWLGTWAPGTQIDLIIKKHEDLCSSAQRGYYFGVIVKLIAEHTGHDTDERSTESLTTKEREEYHEKCRRWAFVVLNITIPLPNEVYTGE